MGAAGACHCEGALADYMADHVNWDFAALCLSVNMISAGFTLDEFRERTSYLIGRLSEHPRRPVACITIVPYFGDWGQLQPTARVTPAELRTALADVVTKFDRPNVHLIEGPDLLTDVSGLTADLLHPSDLGMIQMGENLALRLRQYLEPLR